LADMLALTEPLVVGVDFGTLSGRAVVVRVRDGAELGSAVFEYPHAVVEDAVHGRKLPPDWALQVPSDYVDVLRNAVPNALKAAGVSGENVIGIGTDFTACTMVPVTADGTPLCELPEYRTEPHAYVKLWKHHAAQGQADRITDLARSRGEKWLARYGGLISSEWEFAKGLQILEEAPEVYAAMWRFVEAADWIVWQLTGTYVRNACTAGYKGIHQDGAYPSADYLRELNPGFERCVTDKLAHPLGQLREVPGMCGVVEGGIVPGLWGYEAGQSGVGDIFGWFVEHGVPPEYHERARELGVSVHELLTGLAAQQEVGEHGLVALDWHSGNRSVLVDHELSGVVVGQTLATRAEDTYRALLEATAFGTRVVVDTFIDAQVPVREFVVAGGLMRNPLLMQIYADVLDMPLSVIGSSNGPALGSAIHAAVAAGAYPDIRAAAAAMGSVERDVYLPIPANVAGYEELFTEYLTLHDYFGRGANEVMRRLKERRRNARKGRDQ
jgi:L-ribulokinase